MTTTRADDPDQPSEPSTVAVARSGGAEGSWTLRLIGEGVDASHALPPRGQFVIGRSQKADVRIDHPSISRQHAILYLGEKLHLEDLDSANGTQVGGRRLSPGESVEVRGQELIELGTVMLVVQPGPGAVVDGNRQGRGPGSSASEGSMRELYRLIERIAGSTISILLLGETGVGKEVTAERIHRLSPRAKHAFLKLNCGALSEPLLESELFGHKRGAFTGAHQPKPGLLEMADRGTVFLDEVGELTPALQVKLLRVLEDRQVLAVGGLTPHPVDVRFIAATNRDLNEEVSRGRFRADLFFRLNGISLTIPPLRERLSEIEELAASFMGEAAAKAGLTAAPSLSPEAMAALRGHHWPGNIRELKNVLERAVLLCDGARITPAELRLQAPSVENQPQLTDAQRQERQRILDALHACAGNQTKAARKLGISRGTLVTRIGELGIPRPRKT
jgi:DNA-binding NtrC family response regulator